MLFWVTTDVYFWVLEWHQLGLMLFTLLVYSMINYNDKIDRFTISDGDRSNGLRLILWCLQYCMEKINQKSVVWKYNYKAKLAHAVFSGKHRCQKTYNPGQFQAYECKNALYCVVIWIEKFPIFLWLFIALLHIITDSLCVEDHKNVQHFRKKRLEAYM